MARTTLSPIASLGAYAGAMSTFAFTDLGTTSTDGHQFKVTGAELLLIRNISGGAQNINIDSVDDDLGRSEDIVDSIPANGFAVIGPMKLEGWKQTDGNIYLDSTSTALKAAVVKVHGL